jgi:hypothetical protein
LAEIGKEPADYFAALYALGYTMFDFRGNPISKRLMNSCRRSARLCAGPRVDDPPAHLGPFDRHGRRQMGREISIPMDPLYVSVLVSAEKKFWRCVQSGETPHLVNAEPPRPRIEAIRIIDMSSSNSWAEFAALFRSTARHPHRRRRQLPTACSSRYPINRGCRLATPATAVTAG